MNEILELQSGQVAFISSLMAGFSFSIAIQIIRINRQHKLSPLCFSFFALAGFAFLIALYTDVSLNLRVLGAQNFSEALLVEIRYIRDIGTAFATIALFLFTLSVGLVGWLISRPTGIISSLLALLTFAVLAYTRYFIIHLPL